MRAAIDRAIKNRFLANPNVIRHLGDDGTANRAMRADILAERHRCTGWRRRAGFRHAHTAERKHAKPG
jgi:hypothetical protein